MTHEQAVTLDTASEHGRLWTPDLLGWVRKLLLGGDSEEGGVPRGRPVLGMNLGWWAMDPASSLFEGRAGTLGGAGQGGAV